MLSSSGNLRIRTYTAGGALPVEGALVKIRGGEEQNSNITYTLVTDKDGLTPEVTLPAPSVGYSLSPEPAELPYSIYNVEISSPGYFTKRISGMTVFPGVSALQLVNMIPESGVESNYPRGNVNTVIPESY